MPCPLLLFLIIVDVVTLGARRRSSPVLQLLLPTPSSTFQGCPAPAQEQKSAPVGVSKKVPASVSALVSSVDFTENVAKSLRGLHSRQLKLPSIFLVSVVPPQCHRWLPSHSAPCSLHPLQHSLQLPTAVCKSSPYSTMSLPSSRATQMYKRLRCCCITISYLSLPPSRFPGPWESQGHTLINAEEPLQKTEI